MINTISTNANDIASVFLLGVAGFLLSMFITPLYTTLAYRYSWWKKPRTEALTGEKATVFAKYHSEKHKRGIPNMAGLIMLMGVSIVTLLFNLDRAQTWLPLAAFVGAAFVGLIDDIMNLTGSGKGTTGMRSMTKLLSITALAVVGGYYFFEKLGYTEIHISFLSDLTIGWLMVPLFTAVVVSTANAVNISDGLDGLAGGLLTSAFSSYTAIAFLQGNIGIAGFCMTIVGALLAYVWFNIYPARFFMGDVGSFALGTALGVVAMLTNTVALLPVIAIVFVVEAGSSLLQVLSKKIRGKKLFKVAPIHHHFEALGWPETKVTMRFWVIGQVAAVLGLIIALTGGHI